MDLNFHAKPGSYHHGDLKTSLVDAGIALLEEGGLPTVSLRGVARALEVSHAAPYRHFSSKAALLGSMMIRGFNTLHDAVRAGTEVAVGAGAPAIYGATEGYLDFCLASPQLTALMFARPQGAYTEEVAGHGRRSFGALVEAVARSPLTAGTYPVDLVARMLWGTAVGVIEISPRWLEDPRDTDTARRVILAHLEITLVVLFRGPHPARWPVSGLPVHGASV
jgi:AcrR family transcriptional regulator